MPYKSDQEFMAHVGHLLAKPQVQRLKEISHHLHSNRLEHSINVSYTSYKIAKKLGWNKRSTARGALRNARKLTKLNKIEEDINH